MGRVRAYVGLGSNVGDPEGTLMATIRALEKLPGVNVEGVSRLYATDPVGVTDQPEFRNAVVALDVPSGPTPETGALALLIALKQLERAFGRKRRERWGPRELDLDLLVFGRHRIAVDRPPEAPDDPSEPQDAPWLEVPHPRARERLFVLEPLADLAPGLAPPGWGESVEDRPHRQAIVEGPDAVRPVATWDRAIGWRPIG